MLSIKVTGTSTEFELPGPTEEQLALFNERYLESQDTSLLEYFDSASRFLDEFPVPSEIPPNDHRLQRLAWPVFHTARYAHAAYLIDAFTLEALRSALGSSNNAVTVAYRDNADPTSETPRTFDLFLVDARPLAQNDVTRPLAEPDTDDPWVITLVDKRYYFAGRTGVGQTNAWYPMSWTELFSVLSARLGISVAVLDAIPGGYGVPTRRWLGSRLSSLPTAHLLDAAAHATGGRIVCHPDGTFTYQRPTVTNRAVVTTAHAAAVADDRHATGGLLNFNDQIPSIPAYALGVFYDPLNPDCGDPISLWASTGGGKLDQWVTAALDVSAAGDTATPGAAITQWAQDFYAWQNVPLDATYNGFVDVPKSAFIDAVLYDHDGDQTMRTSVLRPPLLYSSVLCKGWACEIDIPSEDGSTSGSSGSSGSGSSGGGSSVVDVDGEDEEGIYDMQCLDGVQVVTRGKVAHVRGNNRIRHYWYDLYDTIEGCCECPGGPSGSGGSGGSGNCNTTCDQCPGGISLLWQTSDFAALGTLTFAFAPTGNFPCRWVAVTGTYHVTMFYWADTGEWALLVEDTGEVVGLWLCEAFICGGPNTFRREAGVFGQLDIVMTAYCPDSSGSGGSGGDSCCADTIPTDIYLHLTNTGGCADADGSVIHLTRLGVPPVWTYAGVTGGTGGCTTPMITAANFYCVTGQCDVVYGADNTMVGVRTSYTCSPFSASFTFSPASVLDTTCCIGTMSGVLNGTP